MATKTGGGANHLTVQESKNIKLGQLGSMPTKASQDAITPPDGTVFIAITMLYDGVKFDSTGGLIAEDPTKYINTAQASTGGGGAGGIVIDNTVTFPQGLTIYGRWTEIDVDTGTYGGVIAYIGV